MASAELNCASCEEPIDSQGVRCAACRAPHHPKCFFGRGERCAICADTAKPVAFEVARPLALARRAATRWMRPILWLLALAVPVALASLAWDGWRARKAVASSSPSESGAPVYQGVYAIDRPTTRTMVPEIAEWVELALPPTGPFVQLMVNLSGLNPRCPADSARLTAEVRGPGAGPWRPLPEQRILSIGTAWYRLDSRKGFTEARLGIHGLGTAFPHRAIALTAAAPKATVIDDVQPLKLEALTDFGAVVSARGVTSRPIAKELLVGARNPIYARVSHPASGAQATFAWPDTLTMRLKNGGFTHFERLELSRPPLPPSIHDTGSTGGLDRGSWNAAVEWLRDGALWHLLRGWRPPPVRDAVCHPSGSRIYSLMADGRIAVTDLKSSSPHVSWYDSLAAFSGLRVLPGTLPPENDEWVSRTLVARFGRLLGNRPAPRPDDRYAVHPASLHGKVAADGFEAVNRADPTVARQRTEALTRAVPASMVSTYAWKSKEWDLVLLPLSHTAYADDGVRAVAPPSPRAPASPKPVVIRASIAPRPIPRDYTGTFGYVTGGDAQVRRARWGMTEAQVRASEPVAPYELQDLPGGTRQLMYRVRWPNRAFRLMYVFKRDRLFATNWFVEEPFTSRAPIPEYDYFQQMMASSYGVPQSVLTNIVERAGEKITPAHHARLQQEGRLAKSAYWQVGRTDIGLFLHPAGGLQIEMIDRTLLKELSR